MSRKSEKATVDVPEVPNEPLNTYFFPTIGDGISVRARSQKEADALAAEIAKSLAS